MNRVRGRPAAPSSPFTISLKTNPNLVMRDGYLAVTCWCERRIVAVAKSDVDGGRTLPCGHPECANPAERVV